MHIYGVSHSRCITIGGNLEPIEFNGKVQYRFATNVDTPTTWNILYKYINYILNILHGVSARGLDIPHIKTVVNYDVARDIDTHTHRIGRTGRAGEKGTAYTLVTEKDKEFAGHLVRNLEGANQDVPKSLIDLAMQSAWFRKSRFKGGKGKSLNIGGAGLGFRGRPDSSNSVCIAINDT